MKKYFGTSAFQEKSKNVPSSDNTPGSMGNSTKPTVSDIESSGPSGVSDYFDVVPKAGSSPTIGSEFERKVTDFSSVHPFLLIYR